MNHYPDNNDEEVDALMICLLVSATERNSMDTDAFSSDTDVLILIVAGHDLLTKNTSSFMASGILQIKPLWTALGPEKPKALPAFRAFSRGNNTGRSARIGKPT